MVRIESLSIQNFRSIKFSNISFDSDITIICGENNAGKTTLLEAIYLTSNLRSFKSVSNTELIKELFVNKYNQDYQEMGIKYNKYLDYYILVLDELGGHVNKGETNLTKFNAMFALKSRKTITQIWGDDVDAVTTQKEIQKMIKDICAINGCKIIQNK